jgi:hypothetical protein
MSFGFDGKYGPTEGLRDLARYRVLQEKLAKPLFLILGPQIAALQRRFHFFTFSPSSTRRRMALGRAGLSDSRSRQVSI